MADWKSIKVSAEVKEMLDDDWESNESRDAQMKRLLDEEEEENDDSEVVSEINKLRREIDDLQSSLPRQVAQELR